MILSLSIAIIISLISNVELFEKGPTKISSRIHFRKNTTRWPNAQIFYDVDPYIPTNISAVIRSAIDYMNSLTCFKWLPKRPWEDEPKNYITIATFRDTKKRPYCRSEFGMVGGRQFIKLGDWCITNGNNPKRRTTVLHVMMHAMGFIHEHKRADRDCFVFINENYRSNPNYKRVELGPYEYRSPYDYQSVMQYESFDITYMFALCTFLCALLTGLSYVPKTLAHKYIVHSTNMTRYFTEDKDLINCVTEKVHQLRLGRRNGILSRSNIIGINNAYCGKEPHCELYPRECKEYEEEKERYHCAR